MESVRAFALIMWGVGVGHRDHQWSCHGRQILVRGKSTVVDFVDSGTTNQTLSFAIQ